MAAMLGGCASKERLTAKATDCGVTQVTIVNSEFKRSGSTTAWCATCRGKRYQCMTNADRDKAVCFEVREGTTCY
jgi:hypothetical protein